MTEFLHASESQKISYLSLHDDHFVELPDLSAERLHHLFTVLLSHPILQLDLILQAVDLIPKRLQVPVLRLLSDLLLLGQVKFQTEQTFIDGLGDAALRLSSSLL